MQFEENHSFAFLLYPAWQPEVVRKKGIENFMLNMAAVDPWLAIGTGFMLLAPLLCIGDEFSQH